MWRPCMLMHQNGATRWPPKMYFTNNTINVTFRWYNLLRSSSDTQLARSGVTLLVILMQLTDT